MPTTTIRVTSETWAVIRELARESNLSMPTLIARAVEQYRRHLLLQRTNDAYAALRARPEEWAEEQEERRIWEGALGDDVGPGE